MSHFAVQRLVLFLFLNRHLDSYQQKLKYQKKGRYESYWKALPVVNIFYGLSPVGPFGITEGLEIIPTLPFLTKLTVDGYHRLRVRKPGDIENCNILTSTPDR